MNKYAPILILTINRYDHLKRCIESLQENNWAKYTDLYIALDYPPNDKYVSGYNKIKSFLDNGVSGFASVNVIKREYNYGATLNSREARKFLFSKYDTLIFTEDDNVFSPCFIEYMNKCLWHFWNDDSIISINGYSVPVDWVDDGSNILLSQNCFSAWGYGLWKHKAVPFYQSFTLKNVREILKETNRIENLKQRSPRSFCYLINTALSLNYAYTDVVYQNYMLLENKRCIMPKISKVRNMGFDGSGLHNASDKDPDLGYSKQFLDLNTTFEIVTSHPNLVDYYENFESIEKILPASDAFLKRSNVVWALIKIMRPGMFFLFSDVLYRTWRKIKPYYIKLREDSKRGK